MNVIIKKIRFKSYSNRNSGHLLCFYLINSFASCGNVELDYIAVITVQVHTATEKLFTCFI